LTSAGESRIISDMSETLPEHLDINLVAQRKQTLSFVLLPEKLMRLQSASQGLCGSAEGNLHFSLFENSYPMVELSVRVCVILQCQRSLELFPYSLSTSACLIFAQEEDALWPEDAEIMTLEEAGADPSIWIEDSLLLALPLVPVKPESHPVQMAVGETDLVEEVRPNPFLKLKTLMNKES
jgi:uncharacterized protein